MSPAGDTRVPAGVAQVCNLCVHRLKTGATTALVAVVGGWLVSCDLEAPQFVGLPIETRFAFTNFSTDLYAALGIRAHGEPTQSYQRVPLLAPGATFRGTFLEYAGSGCPEALDLQLFVYRRVNDDLPIGLDETEAVESAPVVAGEVLDVPACGVQAVETYTIVNWDTEEGVARVKIAQETAIEDFIRDRNLFDGADATWQVVGVAPDLAAVTPPPLAGDERFSGTVTLADGAGVEGVGVLVRTRFRVRQDDDDATNDPDAGFGEPIAFTTTDRDGAFSFSRPPGAYQVEFFSDDFAFRPDSVIVESPIALITVIAEPL